MKGLRRRRLAAVLIGMVLLLLFAGRLLLRENGISGPPVLPPPRPLPAVGTTATPAVGPPVAGAPVETSAAPPQGGPVEWRVHVLDPDGTALPGARVWREGKGGLDQSLLGATGETGTVVGEAPSAGDRLVVRATGFVPFGAPVEELPASGDSVVVRMVRAGTIRGVLVDAEDRPVDREGSVAVWRADGERTVDMLDGTGRSGDGTRIAVQETDATGRFTFEEAEPGTAYRFAGAVPGMATCRRGGRPEGRTGDPEVRVPMDVLYSVVVRIKDASGGPLHLNRDMSMGQVSNTMGGIQEAGLEVVGRSLPLRWGASRVPASGLDAGGEFVSSWVFCRIGAPGDAALPFSFRAPEYETVLLTVVPRPVGEEPAEIVALAERKPAGPEGSVRFRFDLSKVDDALVKVGGALVLDLVPLPGTRSRTQYRRVLPLASLGEAVFEGVGVGTWGVRLMGGAAFGGGTKVLEACVPAVIEVKEAEEAPCTVTVKNGAILELEVLDSEGKPVDGPIMATLLWGPAVFIPQAGDVGRRSDTCMLAARPYRIAFAPAGSVEVQILLGEIGNGRATVDVPEAGTVRCTVRLEGRK